MNITLDHHRLAGAAAGVLALALVAGCSSGGGGTTDTATATDTGATTDTATGTETTTQEPAAGGSFVLAMADDPGALDPQLSAASAVLQVANLGYDPLISVQNDGTIVKALADTWAVDGLTVTLHIQDGVTCSDGSAFTAQTAADNVAFVADPNNASPLNGVYLPAGVTATADDATNTLTLTLAAPAPFVLNSLANLVMVCDAAMADRSTMTAGTLGTGPYELTELVAGDHITFTKRDGYTWGPNGATTAEPGMPDTFTIRFVSDEATVANLMLSGEVNAGTFAGPDADRLAAAGLFEVQIPAIIGENWFNQAEGRITADPAVRLALAQGTDWAQLATVFTSGVGQLGTGFAVFQPAACTGDSMAAALPAFDVEAAKATLDAAGWTVGADGTRAKDGQALALSLLYQSSLGTPGSSSGELVAAAWADLGVMVTATGMDDQTFLGTLFGGGDWDVAWAPLNLSTPDQAVPFLSGPSAVDGGSNFSAINNADYNAAAEAAMAIPGKDGCDQWQTAEEAIIGAGDAIPFANTLAKFFGTGAEFVVGNTLMPTSVRMVG